MRIENLSRADACFGDVMPGSCFVSEGLPYIKIAEECRLYDNFVNAIRLDDGEPCVFCSDEAVILVDAKVVIEK